MMMPSTITTNDIDLELIFSLGDELEKHCESPYHTDRAFLDWHTNTGPIWKVLITCGCDTHDETLRCDGWVKYIMALRKEYASEFPGDYHCIDCDTEAVVTVLERVG
jgi:hypothetical protein